MKTTTFKYTDEVTEREYEQAGICISPEALENIKRACADTDEGSIELSCSDWGCTDYLPKNWYVLSMEDKSSHGWNHIYYDDILANVIRTCESSLENEALQGICDLVQSGCKMAEIYLYVDDTIKPANRLTALYEAANEIENYCENNKVESILELAHIARRAFSKTAIAKCLNLSLVYDTDEEAIKVEGRPHECRTNKVDKYFCSSALRELTLDMSVSKYGKDTSGFQVDYDYVNDTVKAIGE